MEEKKGSCCANPNTISTKHREIQKQTQMIQKCFKNNQKKNKKKMLT